MEQAWHFCPGTCPAGERRWGEGVEKRGQREQSSQEGGEHFRCSRWGRVGGQGRRCRSTMVGFWMPVCGRSNKSFLCRHKEEKTKENWLECPAGKGGAGQTGEWRAGGSWARTPGPCSRQQTMAGAFFSVVPLYPWIYLTQTLHRALNFQTS